MADALAIAREMIDFVNKRELIRFREMLHDDYTYTGADGVTHTGPEAGVAQVETFVNAFPDLRLEITNEHACGDVAVIEFRGKGTHQAELEGIPPTGKTIDVVVCDVVGVRDGKCLFEREYYDQMSIMQQLGVMPSG
jgi:steroid delta-isomerase-like uncharacterized protein